MPTWTLALVLVGGCILVALGALVLGRRYVPSLVGKAGDRSLSSAFGIATGLFSFVLAFTIGQLYGNFTRTGNDVRTEATQLSQLVRVSGYIDTREGTVMREDALRYANEVRDVEWPMLRNGNADPEAWAMVDHLYADLRATTPSSPSDSLFYGQAAARINDLVTARRARLDDANVGLPSVFSVMLVLGAILALITTVNFKPADDRVQLGFIVAAAAFVGFALLVALVLDYPFSGSVAVSSKPFEEITRAQLLAGR
jgi:hypothetical protein